MKASKVKGIFTITLVVVIVVSSLIGCSFKGNDNANATEQEITYNLGSDPKTLDPGLCSDTTGYNVLVNSFVGLCELDENEKAIKGDAESWDISSDGLTYTFHLRDDLKWSNGDSLLASDYEYAWKRVLNPDTESKGSDQLMYIKGAEAYNARLASAGDVGVKAIDDTTLVVTLVAPTPYFLELTSKAYYYPINQKIAESNKDWASNAKTLVSNGPFKITEYKMKDEIVLRKNENYYDKDSVKLEKLTMKLVSEQTSAWASYKAGQFDVVDTVPKSDVQAALKEGTAKSFPNLATYFLSINVTDETKAIDPSAAKVLRDLRIRKALNLAIDRQVIVDNVTKAGQVPAHGIVAKGIIDSNGADFTEKTTYFDPKGNEEEAKKLLLEAGFPNGKGLPQLVLLYNPETGHGDIMQVIQNMWKKIGINVELRSQEWTVFTSTRASKNYEIARGGWNADYVDPMTFLDVFISTSEQNNSGYNNPQYDEVINKAKKELDTSRRIQLLHQAEDLLMADMPVIPLYYYTRTMGIKDYVKGARVSVMNSIYFKNAYVEGKK